MRRRQEEEVARRSLEDNARREKLRLEEQRRRQEENLRRQRDAVLREEQERQNEYERLHLTLQRDKETTLQNLATEKANRERIEALRKEMDSRQATPLKRKVDAPPARSAAVQRPRLIAATSSASFYPQTSMDYDVLGVYNNRQPVAGNLPPVTFSKKQEGLYFLGQRKCVIVEVDGSLYVKLGQGHEDFLSWLEKTEKVEALRMRGMSTAANVLNMQNAAGFAF